MALEHGTALLVDDLRWMFMTSSYLRTFLRITKFCSSTFFCAFSICLREDLRLHRLVVRHLEAGHDVLDPVAGEQADELSWPER